jgi:hypothetical protein
MEADWEIQLGGGAPIIEANGPGFIDLRPHPERAALLPEAVAFPTLAEALFVLNAGTSPVWTSKCDVWPVLNVSDLDVDELNAPPESVVHALACYIDLLPQVSYHWTTHIDVAEYCKRACRHLRAVPLACCRADFVIRHAVVSDQSHSLTPMDRGITAYITACGASEDEANSTLQAALLVFARVLSSQSTLE